MQAYRDCDDANANVYPGSCSSGAVTWSGSCSTSGTGGCGSGTCARALPCGDVCGDSDGDGYGANCVKGSDCNDANVNVWSLNACRVCAAQPVEVCGNGVDED